MSTLDLFNDTYRIMPCMNFNFLSTVYIGVRLTLPRLIIYMSFFGHYINTNQISLTFLLKLKIAGLIIP